MQWIVKCIVFCKLLRCGRDYALLLLLQAVINQIRAIVAKRDMPRIHAFLGLLYSDLTQTDEFRLRLNSDIWTKKRRLEPLIVIIIIIALADGLV